MRTKSKRGHVAMLLDHGTKARFRKVDESKAKDFDEKARARYSLQGNLIRSGKRKGTYNTKPAQVKAVRRLKPGATIDAAKSGRAYELNARLQRGIRAKTNTRPAGYTGSIKRSPIQSNAFGKIKSIGMKRLPDELLNALKKAGKEVASPQYQAMMKKYAKKYGGDRILQQMYSPGGIFSTRKK